MLHHRLTELSARRTNGNRLETAFRRFHEPFCRIHFNRRNVVRENAKLTGTTEGTEQFQTCALQRWPPKLRCTVAAMPDDIVVEIVGKDTVRKTTCAEDVPFALVRAAQLPWFEDNRARIPVNLNRVREVRGAAC